MKNKLLLFLLSLLGFAACNNADLYGSPTYEYGSPTAEFTIKGRVTDAQGKPVAGIQVTPVSVSSPESTERKYDLYNPAPTVTDKSGSYTLDSSGPGWGNFNIDLRFEDVDGPQNGGDFQTQIREVPFTSKDKVKRESWTTYYTKSADDTMLDLKADPE